MKYVVIHTGGKQYRVAEGDVLEVEYLPVKKDETVTFNEVLLYAHDGIASIGTPHVEGISVAAVVLDQVKGEKIRVAKFKAKARHRRVAGHRQQRTKLKVEAIKEAGKATESQSLQEKPVKSARKTKTS